jgi:Phosphotransferase enzyme family
VLRTAARAGRELGRLTADTLLRGGGLPRRAADLDAATLGRLIGREVTSVEVLDGTTGTTDRCRLRLAGDGTPQSVFVKMAAVDAGTRLFGGLARLGEVEVGFYRDLRPHLDLEAPALLGARFDRLTGRFAIVLEDLVGAGFLDTLHPLTPDRAAAALSTLARLHGPTAGVPVSPAWLGTNSGDALLPLVTATIGRLGRRVAARHPGQGSIDGERILATYRIWAPRLDEGPPCVLHGDPHPGNLYLAGDRVGLLDWQAVRRGNGLRDVTYLLVLGMATADRRAHERDLLDHYRDELAAAGGPMRSTDEVWADHRRMAAYAYVATVFTVGLGGLQGDDVAVEGLRRAAAAIEDLATRGSLLDG